MIEGSEKRHKAMCEEVEAVILKSRAYMAGMFAHDCGFEIDEVVRYQGELGIITNFILCPEEEEGFRVELQNYMDDTQYAYVSVNAISK
jgi:hypothetical protein